MQSPRGAGGSDWGTPSGAGKAGGSAKSVAAGGSAKAGPALLLDGEEAGAPPPRPLCARPPLCAALFSEPLFAPRAARAAAAVCVVHLLLARPRALLRPGVRALPRAPAPPRPPRPRAPAPPRPRAPRAPAPPHLARGWRLSPLAV